MSAPMAAAEGQVLAAESSHEAARAEAVAGMAEHEAARAEAVARANRLEEQVWAQACLHTIPAVAFFKHMSTHVCVHMFADNSYSHIFIY